MRRARHRPRRAERRDPEVRSARALGQSLERADRAPSRRRQVPVHPATQHDEDPRRLALAAARRQVARPLRPVRAGRELEPLPALPGRLRQRLRHQARHAHQAHLPGEKVDKRFDDLDDFDRGAARRVQVREHARARPTSTSSFAAASACAPAASRSSGASRTASASSIAPTRSISPGTSSRSCRRRRTASTTSASRSG